MGKLYRIHPQDNVFVVIQPIAVGEVFMVGRHRVRAAVALALGHKVAAQAVGTGEPIVKFGIPIGVATKAIEAGDHVHLHNLASNYMPYPDDI